MRISDWSSDVCSYDLSRLAECILETRQDIDASGVLAPIVGHVGDGNFHLTFLIDPGDPEELARAEGVNERMVMRALAMGGTCTGDHGVRTGKMLLMPAQHREELAVKRPIKQAPDPQKHMKPAQILPHRTKATRTPPPPPAGSARHH